MIKRFLPTETTYNHNKYNLKPLRAEVSEEANGMFELEIELPKGTQLNKRDIITAPTPRGVQPFRVYRITKTMQGIRAYARHIFYDLANALLLDVRPTNTNGNGALQAIINAVGWSGWTYLSDITDLKTAYYVRKNPVEAIIGAENSILNVWGGNLIRNGREVRIMASGVDRGYEIRLGKNLIGIEDDSDDSNVVTRLYPTFERNQVIYGIPEGYVDSPLVGNYPTPIAKEIRVALTDEQKELPDADIYDILRAFCNNLYSVDNVDKPVVNYKIDFVQLAKVARMAQERKYTYAGLEQLTYETLQTLTYGELQSVNVIEQFTDLLEKVDLYDLVKIKVKELDIDLQARVISYRYDCLGERYAKIELGGFKNSAKYQTSNIVQQIKNEREKASEEFRELYDLAINKVTGNAGGYQITRRNADNEPYETLWMDTPDINTATKVLRINQNGIAGSDNGFNGPYSVAITTDGYVVAERILANQLSAISANLGTVTAGRIQDKDNESYWDLNSKEMYLKNAIIRQIKNLNGIDSILTMDGAELNVLFGDSLISLGANGIESQNSASQTFSWLTSSFLHMSKNNITWEYGNDGPGIRSGNDFIPVVESGTNSNGTWIKFCDGTMICIMPSRVLPDRLSVFDINDATQVKWFFPQEFESSPTVIANISGGNSKEGVTSTITTSDYETDKATIRAFNVINPSYDLTTNVYAIAIAIGRWE